MSFRHYIYVSENVGSLSLEQPSGEVRHESVAGSDANRWEMSKRWIVDQSCALMS